MKNIHKLFFGIAMVAMFTGCSEDKESNPISEIDTDTPTPSVGTLITINAAVDTDQSLSKVALQQADNSLDLLSQWQEDDQIQVFARQNGKNYKISDQIAVENISADGRSCSFNIVLPSEIDPAKTYQVIGLCGVQGSINDDGILSFDASTQRKPILKFRAPLMFAASATSTTVEANFKHIGAYEILHVVNNSTAGITFSHNGYTTEKGWYYNRFRCTYDCNKTNATIAAEDIWGYQDINDTPVPSGKMATIVSWYVPNGNSITQAYLEAGINGGGVRSSNAKTSNTIIRAGNAYHLYVTWDGQKLKFGDQSITTNVVASMDGAAVASYIKGLAAGEHTIKLEGVCDASVIRSAMQANPSAIINLDLRNCDITANFNGVTSLKSVQLPLTTTEIAESAFKGCTALRSVLMPDRVENIGASAFASCKSLEVINIPSKLVKVGANAFKNCAKLTNIALPEKMNYIGSNAFADCDNMTITVAKPDNWWFSAKAGAKGTRIPEQLTQSWLIDNSGYNYFRSIEWSVSDDGNTRTYIINGVKLEMVLVEGGTFWMGAQREDPELPNYDSLANDDEAPVHEVTLDNFYITKYVITRAQWYAIMGGDIEQDDYIYPIIGTSWGRTNDFINNLNELTTNKFRLPTESEWEFAARGGKKSKGYKYSGGNEISFVAWYYGNSGNQVNPVGQRSPNELGIYDMTGNTWEMCLYNVYSNEKECNPMGSSPTWRSCTYGCQGSDCRITLRFPDNQTDYDDGFRLVIRP